jgi:hypothetical protein
VASRGAWRRQRDNTKRENREGKTERSSTSRDGSKGCINKKAPHSSFPGVQDPTHIISKHYCCAMFCGIFLVLRVVLCLLFSAHSPAALCFLPCSFVLCFLPRSVALYFLPSKFALHFLPCTFALCFLPRSFLMAAFALCFLPCSSVAFLLSLSSDLELSYSQPLRSLVADFALRFLPLLSAVCPSEFSNFRPFCLQALASQLSRTVLAFQPLPRSSHLASQIQSTARNMPPSFAPSVNYHIQSTDERCDRPSAIRAAATSVRLLFILALFPPLLYKCTHCTSQDTCFGFFRP